MFWDGDGDDAGIQQPKLKDGQQAGLQVPGQNLKGSSSRLASYQKSTGLNGDSINNNILRIPKEPSGYKQQQSTGNQPTNTSEAKSKKRGRPKKGDAEALKQQKALEKSSENTIIKQKGPKREKWEKYKKNAENKIAELRAQVQTVPISQRDKIRNKISAQQSRLKQRMEVYHLHKLIEDQNQKMNP